MQMLLNCMVLIVGSAVIISGMCMAYYGHLAYKNLSPKLDPTNLPLPGQVKEDEYTDAGRKYLAVGRRWNYAMWVIIVLGGLLIVMMAELSN